MSDRDHGRNSSPGEPDETIESEDQQQQHSLQAGSTQAPEKQDNNFYDHHHLHLDVHPHQLAHNQSDQQPLERHLSTPAHFKPSSGSTQCDSSEIDTTSNSRSLRHHSIVHRQTDLTRHLALRHSHHSALIGRNHKQAHVDVVNRQGSSPSSSTASDSAFSQSRTTLGSETSDRSTNGFVELKKGASRGLFHPADNEPSVSEISQNHDDRFKIIWRDLTYRVPDKKLSYLGSYLDVLRSRISTKFEPNEIPNGFPLEENEPSSPGPPHLRAPTIGKPRKLIFSSLNGCVRSGQLTAILGPSGAGKTTFLKCLTNSIVDGVTGSIDIVGGSKTFSQTSQNSDQIRCEQQKKQLKLCIIPQKDYLFDNLTVIENLLFASRIKNIDPKFEHLENVRRISKLLGLYSCLKLKTSKLSGGQYKRVSIAQELLSKPDILILDEPTSGLDSLTCFRTVSVLRDLVDMSAKGLMPPLAIVMTIHQPQMKIFNLFHHTYILSSMGECVYEGKPEHLIDTVADCCDLVPPSDDLNPASFIIDLASDVYGQEPIRQLTKLQHLNFSRSYNQQVCPDGCSATHVELEQFDLQSANTSPHSSGVQQQNVKDSKHHHVLFTTFQPHEDSVSGRQPIKTLKISDRLLKRNNFEKTFWLHTILLIKRLWISTWRDPLLTTTRISFHLIIPFVFYFIYSQKSGAANACPHVEREIDFQTMTSDENVQRLAVQHNELILTFENTSLFFLLLYSFSMCVLAVTALSFPLNMQILLKETSNGWYSMPRFVMAKTLADLPIELTMPMISVAIAYVLTGQPSSYLCWRMLTVTAVMTLCSLISQTQGLLFGAYFMNNIQAAVFISQASSLPWIMLSGFTTRVSELPRILQWLSFGSIYRLGIESIVAVRYGFGMCPCDQDLINDTPVKMVGIPDQLRSLMKYYLEMYSDSVASTASPQVSSVDSSTLVVTEQAQTNRSSGDIFEKLATTLSRANTYGIDVASCHDVRPFILSAREVDERTLPTFLLILFLIFIGLKILLFYVVRFRTR